MNNAFIHIFFVDCNKKYFSKECLFSKMQIKVQTHEVTLIRFK